MYEVVVCHKIQFNYVIIYLMVQLWVVVFFIIDGIIYKRNDFKILGKFLVIGQTAWWFVSTSNNTVYVTDLYFLSKKAQCTEKTEHTSFF